MKFPLLACIGATLTLSGAIQAQTIVTGRDGQKTELPPQYDQNGKEIVPPPTLLPPAAPLVGGADSCVTPDVLAGPGPYAFASTAATTGIEGQNELLCAYLAQPAIGKDVWFTWNATFTGIADLQTCTQTTLDSKVAIYAGTTCPVAGSALACNDDGGICGLQTRVRWACTMGSDYVIQLGNYTAAGTGGTGTFTIVQDPTPPTNDTCATPATVVGAGPFMFDNTNATTGAQGQAEAACGTGYSAFIPLDLWYVWNATFTGTAAVDSCTTTTVDTKIAVYAGNTCPGAAALGCNDTTCGTQAQTTFPCTVGQDYIIQLGVQMNGMSGPTLGGTGTFRIANATGPLEDLCTSPLTVVGTGPFPFDNTFATTGLQGQAEALCGAGTAAAIKKDLWYVWNATFTGSAGARTCSATTVNTKIAVYNGNTCPGAAALACDDNFCGNQSMAIFPCTAGQDYLIQLGLNSTGTVGGTGTWEIITVATPANDDCGSATSLAGLGTFPFDNTFATTGTQGQTEVLCGAGAAAAIPKDVWFTWNATIGGPVAVSTLGNANTLNTKIAVYDGLGCPGAAAIACNDNVTVVQSMAVFTAALGNNYTFQVGLNNAVTVGGMGTLEIMSAAPPADDSCATPTVLAGAGPYAFNTYFCSTGAEGQTGGACTFTNGINFDEWFLWTPTMTGSATVSTCGGTVGQPSNDTKLAAYVGSACPAPAGGAIACNDDVTCPGGLSTFNSAITFSTTCGQPYLIQVGRYIATTAPVRGLFTIVETGTTCNPGVGYCFGDDSGTMCPCSTNLPVPGTVPPGLPGNGCPNSLNPNGANLASVGLASLASDSVVLNGTGMPNASALYFQGNTASGGGVGVVFGDGLRCASTGVIRLGTKTNSSGASQYPIGADASVSVKGLVTTAPVTKYYQCWYRNSALFCITNSTFNLTNGVSILWAP